MQFNKHHLKGFADAAQSLKLYRRAELRDRDDAEPIIEKLYVDPLQNEGVLETMLRPNTTFVIGRKGTGKSTIFQRAQHEVRKRRRSISAYVDIKTVFESSAVDTEITQKLSELGTGLSQSELRRLLLYRAFARAVFVDVQSEIRDQITTSLLGRLLDLKEQLNAKRIETIEAIDQLLDGAFEADITDVTTISTAAFNSGNKSKHNEKTSDSGEVGLKIDTLGKAEFNLSGKSNWEDGTETEKTESQQYSQILLKTFNINSIMGRLHSVLASINVGSLYIYIDDFSELPVEAMKVFVDTILAPLNNWSNELIKFKVAAYPGRIYYGKIDTTKIDEVYLDTYKLYGSGDVTSMEDKAVDFTRRLIDSRFEYFVKKPLQFFCSGEIDEIYRTLFFASMGNPRILGHILNNLRESHITYQRPIGIRAIQEAASKYFEEKIEPFFGMTKFEHQVFSERSSVFSLKELLESIVSRARELRDYKESIVTRDIKGRTPSSHFHVLSEFESLLSTLELNFFITKYFEMRDRDARTVSVYALNYGLCSRYSIEFGKPSGRKERLYFVERVFDYTPIIRRYLMNNQEIRCTNCNAVHGLDKLDSLKLFDMMCPTCKKGTCSVTNLSKKYEAVLEQVDSELMLPSTEIGILSALFTENEGLVAAEIAGELDCSYQLVGKRGKIMEERGLVDRDKIKGRRIFKITERAREDYFDGNDDRKLKIADP